jgi:hypothetical protein
MSPSQGSVGSSNSTKILAPIAQAVAVLVVNLRPIGTEVFVHVNFLPARCRVISGFSANSFSSQTAQARINLAQLSCGPRETTK